MHLGVRLRQGAEAALPGSGVLAGKALGWAGPGRAGPGRAGPGRATLARQSSATSSTHLRAQGVQQPLAGLLQRQHLALLAQPPLVALRHQPYLLPLID